MTGGGRPARYEIRVASVPDSRRAARLDGPQVQGQGKETVIFGVLTDQPALHGPLIKVRDPGLTPISVRRLDPPSGGDAAPQRRPEDAQHARKR